MKEEKSKEIKSRSWNIEIKPEDSSKNIETKNKIRKVLEMHRDGKLTKEIIEKTGFSEKQVVYIIFKEVTFVLG